MFYLTGMAEKLKYHAFKRNTLLEELQTILHEYPDNEQIIKVRDLYSCLVTGN